MFYAFGVGFLLYMQIGTESRGGLDTFVAMNFFVLLNHTSRKYHVVFFF